MGAWRVDVRCGSGDSLRMTDQGSALVGQFLLEPVQGLAEVAGDVGAKWGARGGFG